jgi:hypothetical protein
MSNKQLVNRKVKATGVTKRLITVSIPLIRAAISLLEKTQVIGRLLCNLQVDTSKVRQLLGWNHLMVERERQSHVVQGLLSP